MKVHSMDDFSEAASWQAVASGQAVLKLSSERGLNGAALRMDFDFKGGGGFVVARKEFALRLPEAYAFSFRVRGAAPRNRLEFKLADTGGRNVWRWQEESYDFRREGRRLRLKGSEIGFAWGPAGGGRLGRLGAVEFAISAGTGGRGTVWIEDFQFEDRTCGRTPAVTTSSSAKGCRPECVLDSNAAKAWRSAPSDRRPWLQLDFCLPREYGGLVIDWEPGRAKRAFVVMASDDGRRWRTLHHSRGAVGERSFVYLPKTESRYLRLGLKDPLGIRCVEVQPIEFSRSLIDFSQAVAARSPRGHFPRYLYREQSYWTCAGIPEGTACALINEEGLVEPDKGTFTLEPFLYLDGRLMAWADAKRSVRLEEGGLPIPTARWRVRGLMLETTVFGTGRDGEATVFVRYRCRNTGSRTLRGRLFVALRPYQVTPPWQAWNGLGGVSETKKIAWRRGAVQVDGNKWVVPMSAPSGFGAATFEDGMIPAHLERGQVPPRGEVHDDLGLASAALRFDLNLGVGGDQNFYVAVPVGQQREMESKRLRRIASMDGTAQYEEAVRVLRGRLGAVSLLMPSGLAREAARTFKTAAGHILINRDGAALQPGPRRYTRSWIRDGVIMGAALLRAGDFCALPEFMRWYASFQRQDGFVPCSVDRSGPDWLVEHDSHGQFIHGVMESYRFTGDRAFLAEMLPHVRKAVRCIVRLRARRLTSAYKGPGKVACYGLLPESASHEGYLAHPVHAYWDDFWALRGLLDASAIAKQLGRRGDLEAFAAHAGSFRKAIGSSIRTVIAERGLHHVPASVEWADFDPTATANAVTLLQDMAGLPPAQLDEMFETYMRDFRRRWAGEVRWSNYTAYEIRIIGALVQLGKRAEALELLGFFLSDRRPRRWNQWPEISWKNPRSPAHLGDVPHTWVAAEFMLVFVTLFAYEREADDALMIGAGVDEEWLAARGGITLRNLPTRHGALHLKMTRETDGTMVVEIDGQLRAPRGGFVLRPPGDRAISSVSVNGESVSTFKDREVTIRSHPTRVIIAFGDPVAPT
jgi:hypothetical protein